MGLAKQGCVMVTEEGCWELCTLEAEQGCNITRSRDSRVGSYSLKINRRVRGNEAAESGEVRSQRDLILCKAAWT